MGLLPRRRGRLVLRPLHRDGHIRRLAVRDPGRRRHRQARADRGRRGPQDQARAEDRGLRRARWRPRLRALLPRRRPRLRVLLAVPRAGRQARSRPGGRACRDRRQRQQVSLWSGYSGRDTARFVPEPDKRTGRTQFQRDRARVLHSSALRRLAAKTQVVQVGVSDFPRTRLTHSLECAQIGRELGAALGCDPDLVDAACLAHDLGHPPFGHNGEAALAEVAADCGGFEGNAQSLRLITRLEAKVPGAGLNLTRATLDATLKYPWVGPSPGAATPAGLGSVGGGQTGKFGAYANDSAVFSWIRNGAPAGHSCLEAQVMDWADDVAYSVHDLEDGLHAGLVTPRQLRDRAEQQTVAELTLADYCPPGLTSLSELTDVFRRLLELDCWPRDFDGSLSAAAAVKSLTSVLIGRLCGAAEHATRPAGRGPLTRYAASLV